MTPVILTNPVVISPLESSGMRAFYVNLVSASTGIRYTNGSGEGNLYASDSYLAFYEGRGSRDRFGTTFTPRIFNGRIHYEVPGATSPTSAPGPSPTTAPPGPSPTMAPPPPLKELLTTMAGGNGQAGNFFDIEAINPISISGFSINAKPGTYTVEVYTRDGSYADDLTNSAGSWQLIQTATGVDSNGENVETPLPLLAQSIDVLPSDGKRAFYVKLNSSNIRYFVRDVALPEHLEIPSNHASSMERSGTRPFEKSPQGLNFLCEHV